MGGADFITEAPNLAAAVSRLFVVYGQSRHFGQLRGKAQGLECSWRTYAETGAEAAHLAAGLAAPPLSLPRRAALAISLPNCPEWLLADFACALDDLVVVGLHAEWPDATMHAVLADAEVVCCLASPATALRVMAAHQSGKAPFLRSVITFGHLTSMPGQVLPNDLTVVSYAEVVSAGTSVCRTHTGFGFGAVCLESDTDPGDDSDIFTLLYSSGTTGGAPKATAVPKSVWRKTNCTPGPFASIASARDRRAVSYMALAHGADRGVVWSVTVGGGSVGFLPSDDRPGFFEGMQHFRPTFFLGMSYFWQDRYNEHLQLLLPQLDATFERRLGTDAAAALRRAEPGLWIELRTALLQTRRGQALERSQLERARSRLGGALLLAATGGGHTPRAVLAFMASCVEVGNETRVMDVYGSTEFPGIATNGELDPDVEVKLLEVRMEDGRLLYSPEDPQPRGEITVRRRTELGRTAYWKRPELDAGAWDKEGFYRTGDVGLLDYAHPTEGGKPRLRVIDRVKNLEEVYWRGDSAWIEASGLEDRVYTPLPEVQSIVLLADRNRDGVVAVVVVPEAFVATWRDRQPQGANIPSPAELRRRQAQHPRGSLAAADSVPPELEADVLHALCDAAAREKLKPYEVPVACILELTPWNEKGGDDGTPPLLTPTGKPLRGAVRLSYLEAMGARYGSAEAAAKASISEPREGGTRGLILPPAAEVVERARALLAALRAAAAEESHSRAQHEFAARFRLPLPVEKRGSRVCDTSFIDDTGAVVPVATTALARDWLAGPQAFEFAQVRDVDPDGRLVDHAVVPGPPDDLPVDGATINIEVALHGLSSPAPKSDTYTFRVNAFETVRRLRRKIAAAVGVPPHMLRISRQCCGELDDDRRSLDELVGGVPLSLTAMVAPHVPGTFYALSREDSRRLNDALREVQRIGLEIRANTENWAQEAQAQREIAELALQHAVEAMDADVGAAVRAFAATWGTELAASAPELGRFLAEARLTPTWRGACQDPPLLTATHAVVRALVRGKRAVLARHEALGMITGGPAARAEALERLTEAIVRLRTVGDECDVDTRALPVTWTMDLNWVVPPTAQPMNLCVIGCGRLIYQTQMVAHIETGCDAGVGVVDDADAAGGGGNGVQMGGSRAVFCDISAALIDGEGLELWAPPGGELPARPGARRHSVDSGLNRRPELHELLQFLHRATDQARLAWVPGAKEAAALLAAYDQHHQHEIWVRDKQHIYWLHRHVLAGKDLGLHDTPASLVLRACDAFADRPCLGVPLGCELVADADLPRRTPRLQLMAAERNSVIDFDGFAWLRFVDLGRLVRRMAAGLLALAPPSSVVAIAGYNDWEWAVADFACAVAGMVSMGIHTSYEPEQAAAVVELASPAVLCTMLDLVGPAGARAPRWDVAGLLERHALRLGGLGAIVVMDSCISAARASLGTAGAHMRVACLPEMVAEEPDPGTGRRLPDPFHARGMEYIADDGRKSDLTTLLFTSGSSGNPKAVAVGVANFVHDIAGDSTEARAFSEAVTVSYIPLSHSSDRYKVWQHVIYGGRVGLCYFAAANWEAHEKDKKDAMIDYASPIDGLFRQVALLRPTNMACPPNIWGGLELRFRQLCRGGMSEATALGAVASLFGAPHRVKALATGGSPTPEGVRAFAVALCRKLGATFHDSYGTTESGAIACDGRRLGPKFEEVEVQLVDRPELGFTRACVPHPCGEVAVRSPSLALGYFKGSKADNGAFVLVDPPARPCPEWIKPPLGPGRWYLTRDLASLDASGKLTLIDRVGAVVRTLGGSVLRLGEIETALESLPPVRLCLCHASGEHDGAAVVVLLHEDAGGPPPGHSAAGGKASLEARPLPPAAWERLQADGEAWSRLQQLLGAAGPLTVGMAVDDWTVSNGLLSGELKKRRAELLRRYGSALEALHAMPTPAVHEQ